MKIKNKNLNRLASLSAVGAGALAFGAKDAHAGIVYTVFAPPNTVTATAPHSSLIRTFSVNPIFPAGNGGFKLFGRSDFHSNSGPGSFSFQSFLKIALAGLNGLQFQSAPGPGFMWNAGGSAFNSRALRSKSFYARGFYSSSRSTSTTRKYYYHASNGTSTTQTHYHFNTRFSSSFTSRYNTFADFSGDKYLLFKFNPTGSQDLYGWLRLNAGCGCGLDTTAVDMAFDDSGNKILAGQTAPEPATVMPTGLAALALGASGIRRWRKSRKQAA